MVCMHATVITDFAEAKRRMGITESEEREIGGAWVGLGFAGCLPGVVQVHI